MAKAADAGKGSHRRKGAQDDLYREGYDNIRWGVLDSGSENEEGDDETVLSREAIRQAEDGNH